MELELVRITPAKTDGVFGVLLVDGDPFCLTVERPWLDNKPKISCIPEGKYSCTRREDAMLAHGMVKLTLQVNNVPGRAGILFHHGNSPKDSEGCILVGTYFAKMPDGVWILESKQALRDLSKLIVQNGVFECPLTITSAQK